MKIKFITYLILAFSLKRGFAQQGLSETPKPKSCVVSLIPEESINRRIQNDANKTLLQMGYAKPQERYVFHSGVPDKIRECLEGNYEDVILITHSAEVMQGHRSLVYPSKTSQGEVKWQVLPWRVFDRLKVGANLRQITLIVCGAEQVVDEYSVLRKLARENKLRLRLQLDSPTANLLLWTQDLRAENLFAAMIAESAQASEAAHIYCLMRTQVIFIYEFGETFCLRNRYQVRLHGPLGVGFKTSTRWLKISVANGKVLQRLSLLNLELGLGRSAEIGLSKKPVSSNQEAYGFSFSPVNFVTIEKQKKEFADESIEETYEAM